MRRRQKMSLERNGKMRYLLDTYALIEIATQKPAYKEYSFDSMHAATTIFNLMELHFYYLKNYGHEEAEKIYKIVGEFLTGVDDEIIKEANKFKLQNLKKRMSFTDCIGYITALKLSAKFVTGDYAFKNFENVEFVK